MLHPSIDCISLSRQLEVAGLKEVGPVVEKEAVLRLTTFLIDKVGWLLLLLIDEDTLLFATRSDFFRSKYIKAKNHQF